MLTILNDPAIAVNNFPRQIAGRLFRLGKNITVSRRNRAICEIYRGHPAVTRSILTGLKELNFPIIYNPILSFRITDTVWVLSGVNTLKYALSLKKRGLVKYIVAGPNIVTFSDDFDSVIGSPLVDLCLVPSIYVRNHYLKYCPTLAGRCDIWPAGVDINFWEPLGRKANKVLIYVKDVDLIEEANQLTRMLLNKDIECLKIVYGTYTPTDYLDLLNQSACMIVYCRSESQGLALAEAWSTNVPTFVKKINSDTINGRMFEGSSSPYLSNHTGDYFTTAAEAEKLVFDLISGQSEYAPRALVKDNMSDLACARMFLSLLESRGILNEHH